MAAFFSAGRFIFTGAFCEAFVAGCVWLVFGAAAVAFTIAFGEDFPVEIVGVDLCSASCLLNASKASSYDFFASITLFALSNAFLLDFFNLSAEASSCFTDFLRAFLASFVFSLIDVVVFQIS